MTQHERILDYIDRFGSISPMEALRISEMRSEGMEFTKTREKSKNRFGETVNYVRYSR